jgi:hypothetical protein
VDVCLIARTRREIICHVRNQHQRPAERPVSRKQAGQHQHPPHPQHPSSTHPTSSSSSSSSSSSPSSSFSPSLPPHCIPGGSPCQNHKLKTARAGEKAIAIDPPSIDTHPRCSVGLINIEPTFPVQTTDLETSRQQRQRRSHQIEPPPLVLAK